MMRWRCWFREHVWAYDAQTGGHIVGKGWATANWKPIVCRRCGQTNPHVVEVNRA